jgi:hypothetical protein
MILYISIFIIIIFYFANFLLYKFYTNKNIETMKNNDNIYFIKKDTLYNILKLDEYNYYKTFYHLDFKTRNINNIDEYINYIKKSVYDPNEKEKDKIKKCINNSNSRLEKINFNWFNGNKAKELPWNIGCIQGKLYENGLPHTRGNIIILSKKDINEYSESKLTNTLIHEKVHIYQKIYKNDVEKYLNEYNFSIVKERDQSDNIRSNPDLNNIIYKDNNNNIYKATYEKNPKSIEDIVYSPINNQYYEHPFENMAIFIENYNI